MNNFDNISTITEELHRTSELLRKMAEQLSARIAEAPDVGIPASEEPSPTLEQVRSVLAEKSRAGFTDSLRSLFQKYGATRLSDISETQYVSLLKDVESLEKSSNLKN